ncbi:MAG: exosortase-associated EpsI family protein [Phycisphaerae bacterium]
MNLQSRKTVVIGAAFITLLCVGTLLRWVRISRAKEAFVYTPLAEPLTELAGEIGPYKFVRDVPLTADILNAAKVDQFVQRDYVNPATGRHMLLYVGYWGRENQGTGHGPEVCYPAVGWTADAPVALRTLSFRPPDASVPTVMALHRFVRAEPEGLEMRAVGFLAVVSGEFKSSSRGVFWHSPGRLLGGGHYLTQVQVSCTTSSETWEQQESDIVAFMEALLPSLVQCLPYHDGQAM